MGEMEGRFARGCSGFARIAGALALPLFLGIPAAPNSSADRGARLEAGTFLVARRSMPDPNFAETVVLLVHIDGESAMGLIVNRRTALPLSRVLAGIAEARNRKDPAYTGGPVDRGGVLALARSRSEMPGARHVFADVYLISTKPLLKKALAEHATAASLHIYLGYSGWNAMQLQSEVERGFWYIFAGDAGAVFDKDPDSVWNRFIRRTELRIALDSGGSDRSRHRSLW